MTSFEAQSLTVARTSLAVAQQALEVQVVGLIISFMAVAAAVIGGVTVWRQLKSEQWTSLLQFEMEMAARRRDFDDIARELQSSGQLNAQQNALLASRYASIKENYLNAIDRFAASILNGQFPEAKLKADYRSYIESALRDHPQAYGPGTRLRNTTRLHERWVGSS